MAGLAGIVAGLAAVGAYVTAERQLTSSIDDTLISQANSAISRGPRGDHGRPDGDDHGGPGNGPQCPQFGDFQSILTAQLIENGQVVTCTSYDAITPTAEELAMAA